MKREKLTLAWRGPTVPVPDIIFDDYVPPAPSEPHQSCGGFSFQHPSPL